MNDNGNGEKDDTIRRMLRKVSKQHVEYPENLWKARRARLIRWIFSRRFGSLIFWTIIIGLVLIYLSNNLP